MAGLTNISNYYHTIRYLKPIQLYYRIFYKITKFFPKRIFWDENLELDVTSLKFAESIQFDEIINENSFIFLNKKKDFGESIDWNYLGFGRLWAYNLNYFEFLHQKEMNAQRGREIIDSFIEQLDRCKVGLEPYPLSLRCVNWIRFFSKHGGNSRYNSVLYKQLLLLKKSKEYHIMGNHLLENGFALLFGAYYFNDKAFYKEAKGILNSQLREQILDDGGHFELSPMYHSIMLFRLLDSYNLVVNNDLFDKELESVLKEKVSKMLSWLNLMTFSNGKFPLMNDAAYRISPTTNELNEYASGLGFSVNRDTLLKDSGYRKLSNKKFELIADIGKVGPDYQPGHAHADTFTFELCVNSRPLIVDTGTSTYEINEERFYQRSTQAHNTVVVNNANSSKVWSGHRVGKRAKVEVISDTPELLVASHDGYKTFGTNHKRSFKIDKDVILIIDEISNEGKAYLHFSPNEDFFIQENEIIGSDFRIEFSDFIDIKCINTRYAPEFNKTIINKSVCITFKDKLETLFK